jgi:hypothetical protein
MDASEGIDGRKRVALALLGLRRSDRQWLLGQLPDSERDGVVAMLSELERMKLPAAPQQIAAAAHAVTAERGEPPLAPWPDDALPAPGEPPATDDAQPRHALAQLSTAAVHRALRDEPDAVIASVSALGDEAWAAELSGRFESARAAAIARLRGKASALPPAVANALLEALTARAAAFAGDGEAGFAAELRAASRPEAVSSANGHRWWKPSRSWTR